MVVVVLAPHLYGGGTCYCRTSGTGMADQVSELVSASIQPARVKAKEITPLTPHTLDKDPADPCPPDTHPKVSQQISLTYNPDAFQIDASVLGPRPTDIAHQPSETRELASHSPLALWELSPTYFPNTKPYP